MTNSIVVVNVSQTIAPAPSTLQKTGALLSQGGTTITPSNRVLLTAPSDLTAVLKNAAAITSLAWATGVVTVTTSSPHGYTTGLTIPMVIAGADPDGFNGTFDATITGASTFTYPLASDPGSETVPGTYQPWSAIELLGMVTTYFAQGSSTPVYALELGAGDAATGVTALNTWIGSNPNVFYSYLVPRSWADESTYLTFLAQFESPTSKTYFFTTMTLSNYTSFTALMKCVVGLIEAPSVADLKYIEFSLAAPFYRSLSYAPSTSNQVTPFAFAFLFGVTPYPLPGNGALFETLKAASINWVATGAEGGISNTLLKWGMTKDGRDFTYWYSVDWVQINLSLDLSNEIINGSNNPLAPLYYNQSGINRLQARAQGTMSRGVTFGLVLAPVSVDAVTFAKYVVDNPSDYPKGVYNGLSSSYTPARGFIQITFNVNVTDFPTA
jgi:hypothetical protein